MVSFRRPPFSPEREVTRAQLRTRAERMTGGTGVFVLGAFFSVALFLCVLLFSFSQVTEPDRVKNYIGFGIAALTEIDQHLFNELPDLQEVVRGSENTVFLLPNFPLDIPLSRNEVLISSRDEIRDLVLTRSSDLVYEEGLASFDRTGQQDFGYFSLAFAIEQVLAIGGKQSNSLSFWFSLVAFLFVVLAGAGVVVSSRSYYRFQNLGIAALFSSIPTLIVLGLITFLVRSFVGNDLFAQDMLAIFENIIGIFQRNFLIAAVFGCGSLFLSWIFVTIVKLTTLRRAKANR
tara:strand:+ start:6468 stop:7337 length:870 start_codon:yes stop_codon:yes gene_type:complete